MQRGLIILGIAIVLAGVLWPWLSKLPFGRLPGDIRIEGEHGGFFFPITTSIIVSLVLSLILWFFRRGSGCGSRATRPSCRPAGRSLLV
jgi:hypothetical protein